MTHDRIADVGHTTIKPNLGMIAPKMGIASSPPSSIADAIFTKGQQRVLSALFGRPDRSFYVNELVRLAGGGIGAVQRELGSLVSSGLVTVRSQGNQRHYQANPNSPVFEELRGLVVKTFGVADWVRQALVPLADRLRYACIYGSTAKGTTHAASDVDVMLVSDELTLEDVLTALAPAERGLGRQVNPTLYAEAEFSKRARSGQGIVAKVLAGETISLIGSTDGLL